MQNNIILFFLVLVFAIVHLLCGHNLYVLLLPLIVYKDPEKVFLPGFLGGIVYDLIVGLPLGVSSLVYSVMIFICKLTMAKYQTNKGIIFGLSIVFYFLYGWISRFF
jgi:cell shape-determining protein MreD